ncbi:MULTISPECIES: Fur family transcriptional regulator [unclassified Dietzia]|uniref:Fur family transcriptional regulator n=1 Tax=unclassified Dietzia TaxID=2617939 RepID=UPI000D2024A9|nr:MULTISPECIES: Fur family transcriptional regulator [unclassified Dietzia]AVZ38493.1 transcriptional repressor [Dietzia sp. JS16-p6b]MBB1024495.1 transcriptional repressor [Dietzia sp. DQ12-76]MBB1026205.1 transcriptional repressor [Dietzia sp. DQ11-38-2]
MTTDVQDPGAQLRSAGLRVTSPRLAVLAVVDSRPHIAAEDVAVLVRERLGAVSTQTVYDALRVCTDVGLMRRIEPAGSPARYERRTGDNHHHLVCRQCGRIEDVECAVGHAPCLQADHDHGFLIDEAEVNYWGTCPECQAGGARLGED